MPKGKIAAQVAHASLGVILPYIGHVTKCDDEKWRINHGVIDVNVSCLHVWLNAAFTKVCVKVSSLEELEEYEEKLTWNDIPTKKIVDSGKTIFNGVPTVTCLGVLPYYNHILDEICGDLSLL